VLALVEIIRDILKRQALKRMEADSLTDDECERLGRALIDLDEAIEDLKRKHGLEEAVQQVRDGLDDIADKAVHPERWPESPTWTNRLPLGEMQKKQTCEDMRKVVSWT